MFSLVPERVSASQAALSRQQEEAKREQKDDERLKAVELLWRVAKATDNTAALDAAHKAWRASKDVAAAELAKPEDKKQLRAKRDRLERDAQAARCRRPSTCILGGVQLSLRLRIMVPSCRRP